MHALNTIHEINIDALKSLQEEYGLNEANLAKKIGVSRSCVNRIIKKERKPSFKFISGLKYAFPDYPIDNLFVPMMVPMSDTKAKGKGGV